MTRTIINEDATFLISDEIGDITEGAELGLYHQDTRFLSCYALQLDGQRPVLLASRATHYDQALRFLTNPALPGAQRGLLGITRRQQIERGLVEQIEIVNYGAADATFSLDVLFDVDFAHLFEVKHSVEVSRIGLHPAGALARTVEDDGRLQRFHFAHDERPRQLLVALSQQPSATDEQRSRFELRLEPRQRWSLQLLFQPVAGAHDAPVRPTPFASPTTTRRDQLQQRRDEMLANAPTLETDLLPLRQAYIQSLQDFAALRIDQNADQNDEFIIAAGIPWFMTLFGRDSLISAYQALPFFPSAAKGVLRALARLQGTHLDPLRVEEPGKILHEYRDVTFVGTQSSAAVFPYYGTIDATPLFLMLLAAVHRVTGDTAFSRSLREPALRALEWMTRFGDRDGDGYLEYIREVDAGLENQGWKDSGDSMRFRDGAFARAPIALCEVQGYAYAARLGMAEVFDSFGEPERATTLRAEAAALKQRFNHDFWMEERGYYALALDSEKRRVDALTSNPGHLLWTGIADDDKARLTAQRLVAPDLFSGWGVRTMATTEGAYNPISYHNGSVWPHDTSLIALGLARYGYMAEARQLVDAQLAALTFYDDHRLPELFAGYSKDEAPFPVAYPTASKPQAWASGAPLLLLSTLLGFDANAGGLGHTGSLPLGGRWLRCAGLWLHGQRATIELTRERDGAPVTRVVEQPE